MQRSDCPKDGAARCAHISGPLAPLVCLSLTPVSCPCSHPPRSGLVGVVLRAPGESLHKHGCTQPGCSSLSLDGENSLLTVHRNRSNPEGTELPVTGASHHPLSQEPLEECGAGVLLGKLPELWARHLPAQKGERAAWHPCEWGLSQQKHPCPLPRTSLPLPGQSRGLDARRAPGRCLFALPAEAAGEEPARRVTVVLLPAFSTVPASRGGWMVQPCPRQVGPHGRSVPTAVPAEPRSGQGNYSQHGAVQHRRVSDPRGALPSSP